jgi:hypothetical protein
MIGSAVFLSIKRNCDLQRSLIYLRILAGTGHFQPLWATIGHDYQASQDFNSRYVLDIPFIFG